MYNIKSSYLCSKIPAAFQCTATQLSWQQLCTLGSVALCCRRQGSLKLRNRAMTQRSNSACPEILMKAASRSIEHCSFHKSGDPIGSQAVAGSVLSSTGHIWKKKITTQYPSNALGDRNLVSKLKIQACAFV